MSKPAAYILKCFVAALVAGIVFYLVALAPRYAAIHDGEKDLRALEGDLARLRRETKHFPPIPPQEKELWDALGAVLAAGIFEESNLTGALAGLSELIHRADATLVMVTFGNAPAGEGRRSEARASSARRAASRLTLPAEMNRAITFYPVTIQVKGPYACWSRLLAEMSKELVPVLLNRIEGHPAAGGSRMRISLDVPTLRDTREAMALRGKPQEVALTGLPRKLELLYGLDRLQRPSVELMELAQADPFPLVSEEKPSGPPPELVVSAIVERNGEYVAVINKKVLCVGDEIEGRRIVKITPSTVILR